MKGFEACFRRLDLKAEIIAWSGILAGITFLALTWWGALRIDEETEDMGMDAKSHSPPKAYALASA